MKTTLLTYPRSGKHLTAAIIGKPTERMVMVDDSLEKIRREVESGSPSLLVYHFLKREMRDEVADYLRDNTKTILIVRDPKDVLLSNVFMMYGNIKEKDKIEKLIMSRSDRSDRPKNSFETKVHEWKDQINGWFDYLENPFVVRYENWINAFDKQARLVSEYLGVETLKEIPSVEQVQRSRLGVIGDHKNHFSKKLIDYIDDTCKKEIELIDKYLL
jgi:hypothetical protein